MEKINYRKQELDLVDRLLRIIESGATSKAPFEHKERASDQATDEQLRLLNRLGLRPLWKATKQDAEELIANYKAILAPRIP
jgi:hypothetical protein